MNNIHRLAFFLTLCVANQTLFPIIVTAAIMSKEIPNGKTQRIVLLGDRHISLKNEPESNKEKLRITAASEHTTVLDWAKKCGALVLAEDFAAIKLDGVKQGVLTLIKKSANSCTFLSDLTTHCQEKNIPAVNLETRPHAFISEWIFFIVCRILFYFVVIIPWIGSFNHLINKHKWKLILASMFPLLANIPLMYSAYHEHTQCNNEIAFHQDMVRHIDFTKILYKQPGFNLALLFSGWLVDTKILSTLHTHQNTETIFICAGALHTEATKKFLSEQGYAQESMWEDQLAKKTNFTFIDLDQLINLDVFLQTLQA